METVNFRAAPTGARPGSNPLHYAEVYMSACVRNFIPPSSDVNRIIPSPNSEDAKRKRMMMKEEGPESLLEHQEGNSSSASESGVASTRLAHGVGGGVIVKAENPSRDLLAATPSAATQDPFAAHFDLSYNTDVSSQYTALSYYPTVAPQPYGSTHHRGSPYGTSSFYAGSHATQPYSGVLPQGYSLGGDYLMGRGLCHTQRNQSSPAYLPHPYGTTTTQPTYPSYATYGNGQMQQNFDYASTYSAYQNTNSYAYYSTPHTMTSYGSTGNCTPRSDSEGPATIQGISPSSPDQGTYSIPDDPTVAPASPERKDRRSSSSRKRTRRQAETPPPVLDQQVDRVFIWDLDETIIVFNSLLKGDYSKYYHKDTQESLNLGLRMEELIFHVADTHFYFPDLSECDQIHIDDVAADDNGQDLSTYNFSADGFQSAAVTGGNFAIAGMRGGMDIMKKMAFRYRRIKELYNSYRNNVGGLLGPQKRDQWLHLREEIEQHTDSWLSRALKCLGIINSRKHCVNVLVTKTQLVPALAKVLLHGLANVFDIENIYSSNKTGKEYPFELIRKRFGGKCIYIVIGGGKEESELAVRKNFPYWKVECPQNLQALEEVLRQEYL